MSSIIQPNKYTEGYKAKRPMKVAQLIFDVYSDEAQAIRRGKRGYSCKGSQLTQLGKKCVRVARDLGAKSWSIYPLVWSRLGWPKVWIEFHNWPGMGLCNFKKPIGKDYYIWDVVDQPRWLTGDQFDNADVDGNFDLDA